MDTERGWIVSCPHHKHKNNIESFDVHFLRNLAVDLDEIQYVATTCSFVELVTSC